MKPENIREFVWKAIDTDISLKKDISRNLINMRSLARYLIDKYKLKVSIDSIISAIRRYPSSPERNYNAKEAYDLLKQAKIRTMTKMASISLKKNEEVTEKLGKVLPSINFEIGEVLRILEGAKLFRIIVDQKSFPKMLDIFSKKNILDMKNNVGMIEITYPIILEETPGVFSAISTELGANEISIIDALIISNEQIIIVEDRDLLRAFDILYNLCK